MAQALICAVLWMDFPAVMCDRGLAIKSDQSYFSLSLSVITKIAGLLQDLGI